MKNKKCIRFYSIFLICLFFILPQSLHGDDYSLINLDVEAFSATILGEGGCFSSGVYLDMYFGLPILLHLGASYGYLVGFKGWIPEAGIGIVLANNFSVKNYSVLFYLGSGYNEFGQPVREYLVSRGKCYAAEMHIFEAGTFAYLLKEEHYGYETEIWDIIFYGGYRYSSFYEVVAPLEELNLHLYALVGLVGRYSYEKGDEYYDQDRIAYGGLLGCRWYFFVFDAGYYDDFFFLKAGMRIPVSFLMH